MGPQLSLAEQFGRRLRQLRREKSATEERDVEQGEVADAVGETQPNLARYERGRIPKDETVTRRLAQYYGVNYAWLRLNEGEKYPTKPTLIIRETESERDVTAAHQPQATAKRAAGARGPRNR